MNEKIKEMIEDGFAIKRIAVLLQLPEKDVREVVKNNKWQLIKEDFNEDKIDRICYLYEQGLSAKSLGIKFSIDKRRIQKWVEERGLLRDKLEALRFTRFNEHIFDVIDTKEKAYWLGFFYADAYNSDKINTFSLSLKDEDYNHLVKLCNFIDLPTSKIIRYLSNINDKTYPSCSVKMYSKHVCQKMIEHGCPRAKSFIIQYPAWLNTNLDQHFIRGMFDGDGSLSYRENSKEWKWSLVSTNECCGAIQKIILSNLGFIVNFHSISKTNNNTYELEQSGNEKILKIMDWLYLNSNEDIRLTRKYEKYLELVNHQNSRTFIRKEYKVSETEKNSIINEISIGNTIKQISDNHNIHPRTVTKIKHFYLKHCYQYLYDKIVEVNGQLITAQYVKTLNRNERENLIEPIFEHFRRQGWLYPDNFDKVNKSWEKLCNTVPDLSSNELFNNGSLATDVCKYFCHKFYDATEKDCPTMIEIFNDDFKLKRLIRNRLGLDWYGTENKETFNISFRMLIQGMRSSRLVPSISIFKPYIAKYLCMKYSEVGDTIYDYSAGWGGRMLGAASCNRKYIGVDPLTTDELQVMSDTLGLKNIQLIKSGSENVRLNENTVDFSFSSPPYFNQEYYSSDLTQAYNNGQDYFYNVYWENTLNNIKYMLKPNKLFGLNVKNYHKMLQMAIDKFGEPIDLVSLRTIRSHLNKSAGIDKNEYIYIFKK